MLYQSNLKFARNSVLPIVRPLLEVNRLAKFVRLCFNVLCFILALFFLQWFILLNRTRSLLFFTFEVEGLLMGNYLFVKMNSSKISIQHSKLLLTHIGRIVNIFLTIGTIKKGKSSGQPPVSDEIVEDLNEMVEKTPQISAARLSQQSGISQSTCHKIIKNRLQLHPYKIMYKTPTCRLSKLCLIL
jgi:hypothetical protein